MPVYHIVLFKLKPGTPQDRVDALKETAQAMVGQIPGLQRLDFGPPLPATASRGKGFDMGLIAILDNADTVKVYSEHPAHQGVHAFRQEICEDALAYDLEY